MDLRFVPCKVAVLLHWHFDPLDQMCRSCNTSLGDESVWHKRIKFLKMRTFVPCSYMSLYDQHTR